MLEFAPEKKDGTECPSMTEIIRMLEQNGMKIVKEHTLRC